MDFTNIIAEKRGELNIISNQIKDITNNINSLNKKLPSIEKAVALLQEVAENTQNQIKEHIEDIVDTGLDTCFPGLYTCHIAFVSKRNKTECEIYLKDDEGNRINPIEDSGGGLSDIVSFSLRMACWTMSSTDNLIVLDEPFKFLSTNLRPLAGSLLKELSNKLNLQMIIISHDEEMIEIADRIFLVNKDKKFSKIEEKIIT